MIQYAGFTKSIRAYADSFIAIAAKYTPESGILHDTFNKTDGSPVGSPGLSWHYAAALTAFSARDGYVPRSWGAANIKPSQSYQLPVGMKGSGLALSDMREVEDDDDVWQQALREMEEVSREDEYQWRR